MSVQGPDLLTDVQRETALSVIDEWRRIAEQKDEEAVAAYALARERETALAAMTDARDLCKQQTADAAERYQALAGWLREFHPAVYAEAMELVTPLSETEAS